MFEQVLIAEGPATKRFWTTCAGVTGQFALVASMILAPMVWPEVLPRPQAMLTYLLPPVPPPPPPPGDPHPQVARAAAYKPFISPTGGVIAPTTIPKVVAMIDEPPLVSAGAGIAGGTGVPGSTGVPGGLSGMFTTSTVAPPLPVVAAHVEKTAVAPEPPARVKLGGVVLAGNLISRIEPQYPSIARQMRVQGVVELMAVVGTDGRIRELRLLSGNPLLAPAAIDAVKRWLYKPTYLNGDPVEVMAPITVTFKLN